MSMERQLFPEQPEENPESTETPRQARDAWTPTRGLAAGGVYGLIAASLMSVLWCILAAWNPESVVVFLREEVSVRGNTGLVAMGALTGFVFAWILFAVVHRAARFVGWPTSALVVVLVILMTVAKQMVVAKYGVDLPSGRLVGAAWLSPALFVKSNLGVWFGLAGAVWVFREGDSLFELLR